MYIMNSEGTQIINSEFIERFLISEKPDAVLVVLSYGNERPAKRWHGTKICARQKALWAILWQHWQAGRHTLQCRKAFCLRKSA